MVLRGLYALTPDMASTDRLLLYAGAVYQGGGRILQYRNKKANADLKNTQAAVLAKFCKTIGLSLIINDDVDLALAVNADGVHLGGSDGDLIAARQRMGSQRLLGASCYANLAAAQQAVAAGVDYVAFGAIYPSASKPDARRASLNFLATARRDLSCPIAAIGGITLLNAPPVLAAGADLLAVITDLSEAPDLALRASEFQSLFA